MSNEPLNNIPKVAEKQPAHQQGPHHRIRELLEEVDKMKSQISLTDEEFVARVLYSRKYTLEEYRTIYKENDFQKLIIGKIAKKDERKHNVFEIYISIPEITGMLPYPDFNKIRKAEDLLKNSGPSADSQSQSQKKDIIKAGQKELQKIERFPRAFYASDSIDAGVSRGDLCRVSIQKDKTKSVPGYFAFKFISAEGP